MLPYSPRKDFLSFTDKKWDWRYQTNRDGSLKNRNPALYEIFPSEVIKDHRCQVKDS